MGVKNFSFCTLLTRPWKHARSEFQLFTAPLTSTITSGHHYPLTHTNTFVESARAEPHTLCKI